MALADKRDHRHAHGECFDRAIDAAVRHRVEHEIDEPVARLVLRIVAALRQEQQTLARRCRLPAPAAGNGRERRVGGRKRERRARDPREHVAPQTETAPRQLERAHERADDDRIGGEPSVRRSNGYWLAGATCRNGNTQPSIASRRSIWNSWFSGTSA